jgi:O-antigen/teichoic acid export membrane protein
VALFGELILITSYATAVSGISKFQSWQLIVRFGGHGVAHGDPEHFKVATGFAFALDLVSGVAGMLVAVALLPFIGGWVGISPDHLWLALLYCTLLPTMGSATPSGVFRVLDRFDLIGWSDTVKPISRALLALIAFLIAAPFAAYVAIWYVTDLAGDLYTWLLALRELRRTGHLKGIRPTLKPTVLAGAWRFAIEVNLSASVQAIWGPVGRLVVGGLLGSRGAALFRIASSLSDAAQKPADLLGRAFYPEIMRMDLSTKKPWKLMARGTAVATTIATLAILILLVGGRPMLSLIFGKQFLGAYTPLMVLMIVPFLGIFSFALAPMLLALGRSDGPLKAKILATAVFLGSIAPLSWSFGVLGAAVALVLGEVTNVAVLMLQLRREHRRVRLT